MANYLNIHVRILHKGKIVTKEYFEKNNHLWYFYPSQFEFLKAYFNAMDNTKDNMISYVDVDENGISLKLNVHLLGEAPEK